MPQTIARQDFERHYRSSLIDLRNAIAEALIASGADPARPQDTARDLKINRNLTWKLSKLISARDLESAFSKVPGPNAIKILVTALGKANAPAPLLARIQSASDAFEAMVISHAGDRPTLELMLDSANLASATCEPLELSRKLAFQGNSGIWGCQAKVRVRAVFLAPNASRPDMLDIAHVSGLHELRRFRADAIWPLFKRVSFADDGTPLSEPSHPNQDEVDFDPGVATGGPPLLRRFCSKDLPELLVEKVAQGNRYSFGEGRVGNTGRLTVMYGAGTRCFAPRYRDEHNDWAESFLGVNAPAESLLMDIFIHRDMVDEVQLETKLLLGDSEASFVRSSIELPSPEAIRDLGAYPPMSSTPLMPKHGEMIDEVFSRMAWSGQDFAGFRLEIKHPPTPSTALLRYRLPER